MPLFATATAAAAASLLDESRLGPGARLRASRLEGAECQAARV